VETGEGRKRTAQDVAQLLRELALHGQGAVVLDGQDEREVGRDEGVVTDRVQHVAQVQLGRHRVAVIYDDLSIAALLLAVPYVH